ncbi:sigma-70 family RNA polymerase sigma factor [Aquihabitans daechungensis]|uniref:sigma-70 family RNA polymerase sigma factor n=1 Tax=Aquihabitans daechungensis TaxID=1052257 RepID=UPI003B9F9607
MSTLPSYLDAPTAPIAPPRRLRAAPSAEDAAGLERTIPRGRHEHDADPTPAVDHRVWLDHVHFARSGDPVVLARLVSEYEGYARSLARRMWRDGEPSEDLNQVALESLVVALQRFDPERGIPFPAFATPTILGSIRRHYRDQGWLVRVPRRVHEFAVAERAATERLVVRLNRQPTTQELAREMRTDIDSVLEAQDALHARNVRSLETSGADGRLLSDLVGTEDGDLAASVDRLALIDAMRTLDEPAKELLRLSFFEERSQADIALQLGVSQMQVSRLLAAILRRLRTQVGPR